MPHRIVATEAERAEYLRYVASASLPRTFEDTPGRDRSADQNRLMWLWATEAAHQRGDVTSADVQQEWKLHHGVPILREHSAEFRRTYDECLKALPYPLKLKMMRYMPVTSEMKVPQMIRFLDAVERECAENGIKLTDPDPELAAYQQRYRKTETKDAA